MESSVESTNVSRYMVAIYSSYQFRQYDKPIQLVLTLQSCVFLNPVWQFQLAKAYNGLVFSPLYIPIFCIEINKMNDLKYFDFQLSIITKYIFGHSYRINKKLCFHFMLLTHQLFRPTNYHLWYSYVKTMLSKFSRKRFIGVTENTNHFMTYMVICMYVWLQMMPFRFLWSSHLAGTFLPCSSECCCCNYKC